MRIGRRMKGAALALLFLMGVSTSAEVWAQNTSPSGGLPGIEAINPMQQLRQRMQAGGASLAWEVQERAGRSLSGRGDRLAGPAGGPSPARWPGRGGAVGGLIIPLRGAT